MRSRRFGGLVRLSLPLPLRAELKAVAVEMAEAAFAVGGKEGLIAVILLDDFSQCGGFGMSYRIH